MGQKVNKRIGYFAQRVLIAFGALALLVLPTMPVFAESPDDAVITLVSVNVYRNLVETGDMAIVYHAQWSSGNTTSTPASSAVLLSLSYNGSTVASTSPYVFNPFDNNGYGDFMSSFYFSANSTAVWDGVYTIHIDGLPAFFGTPPTFLYQLQTSDYTSAVTQEANQQALKAYILEVADAFAVGYPDVLLKSSTEENAVLSEQGESYLTGAIAGLRSLCPDLFLIQVYIPTPMTTQTYTTDLQDTYTARLEGSDIKRGATRLGAVIGVSWSVILGLFTFAGCLVVLVKTSNKGWPLEAGLFICGAILTGAAYLIGDVLFTLTMIMGFIAVIGLGWVLFGKKA